MITLNNKWTEGKAKFNLKCVDWRILRSEGIIPIQGCLSEKIGLEVVILYLDHTPFIYELERIRPFNMYLKSGLGRTTHGPIMFHLFQFFAESPKNPVLLVDAYANPFNAQHMTTWRDLSRQSHWHLFLVDSRAEQAGFFEFTNTFDLDRTLDTINNVCQGMKESDFTAAKNEFCSKYTIDDLNIIK